MRFGISIVMPGMYVSSSSAMSSAMINGTHSLINSCILQSVMDTQVNIIEPNGGVRPPIMMLTLQTMPKCTRSIPAAFTIGTHERSEDDERRAALEEHADDEQHDVHDQQHEKLVAGKARHGVEQHSRDVLPVEVVAEHGRRHDDEHDGGGAGDGLAQDGDEVLLAQALVDELAHDQAVEHAHTAGFRSA